MEKEKSIVQKISEEGEQEALSGVIQKMLPKITPMLRNAINDFSEYLSGKDDGVEKTIVIRKLKDRPPMVMVFSNKEKFHIECSNDGKNVFTASKQATLHLFTAEEFLKLLISGCLKK